MKRFLLVIFALGTLYAAWSQDGGRYGNLVPDTKASAIRAGAEGALVCLEIPTPFAIE